MFKRFLQCLAVFCVDYSLKDVQNQRYNFQIPDLQKAYIEG